MKDIEARLRQALSRPSGPSSDFDLNPGLRHRPGQPLRPAAVLLAFWLRPDGVSLILTKRASHLKHHPGQIAFPGGKVDPTDPGPMEAALREAREETGLDPAQVEILGKLPLHETVTGFAITPFVGLVHGAFDPVPEAGEVDEIFTVPAPHVLAPGRYSVQGRRWMGEERRYYAVPWGPHYIWGATARILFGLASGVSG
ncbi:MAG: CoA pyrophosphatase [Rhodobacterales bacterium 32-66-7]|nr:MAG: CoA pyrophosphatase [Rhodobacterales bacterium 32-66-7]